MDGYINELQNIENILLYDPPDIVVTISSWCVTTTPLCWQLDYIALRNLNLYTVWARTTRQAKAVMRNPMYAKHRKVHFMQLCGIPCTFAIELTVISMM